MTCYSRSHLADHTLLETTAAHLAQHDGATAIVLADLAEVDKRRLYVPAGFPSMYLFCVRDLHMSEDAAFKRIRAARAARQFPAIFEAVADGRLHLSAVVLLAPHLTTENAAELLAAAEHQTKAEIELLLAWRFPRPDVSTYVQAIAPPAAHAPAVRIVEVATRALAPSEFRQLAPGPVATIVDVPEQRLVPEHVSFAGPPEMVVPFPLRLTPESPATVVEAPARTRLAPLSPDRFALQVTVDQETHELLRYAQALLGHAVPTGDVATILKRSLGALVRELEQQKFAKSARSRPQRGTAHGRYVPAEVRRTVWQRDGGQCTFVSDQGKRCESRTRLEFDHVDPVARGGQASVTRVRLRCRAHNQYAAECAFGTEFMRGKRQEARCRAAQGAGEGAISRLSTA
jgi:hypothetical protein